MGRSVRKGTGEHSLNGYVLTENTWQQTPGNYFYFRHAHKHLRRQIRVEQ